MGDSVGELWWIQPMDLLEKIELKGDTNSLQTLMCDWLNWEVTDEWQMSPPGLRPQQC